MADRQRRVSTSRSVEPQRWPWRARSRVDVHAHPGACRAAARARPRPSRRPTPGAPARRSRRTRGRRVGARPRSRPGSRRSGPRDRARGFPGASNACAMTRARNRGKSRRMRTGPTCDQHATTVGERDHDAAVLLPRASAGSRARAQGRRGRRPCPRPASPARAGWSASGPVVRDVDRQMPGLVLGVDARRGRGHDQPSRAFEMLQDRRQRAVLVLLDGRVADLALAQQRADQRAARLRSPRSPRPRPG